MTAETWKTLVEASKRKKVHHHHTQAFSEKHMFDEKDAGIDSSIFIPNTQILTKPTSMRETQIKEREREKKTFIHRSFCYYACLPSSKSSIRAISWICTYSLWHLQKYSSLCCWVAVGIFDGFNPVVPLTGAKPAKLPTSHLLMKMPISAFGRSKEGWGSRT